MAYEEIYRAGTKRENLVVIYRRSSSSNLYYRAWRPGKGGYVKRSLRHGDVEAAKAWADQQAAKIRTGKSDLSKGRVTLERLFRLYLEKHSPLKNTKNERREDRRRAKMWKRVLGKEKDPEDIKGSDLNLFAERRGSGEIDCHGNVVEDEDDRQPVRPVTVRADLAWLRGVLLWAREDEELIDTVKVKRKHLPEDPNPRRKVATQERVEAIREVYREPQMQVTWGGEVRKIQSFLPAVFELAVGTGRRISAIRTIKYSQLHLDEGPHGKIFWPADNKGGTEAKVAIPQKTRRALDEHLRRMHELVPSIGETYIFPGASDPTKPISQNSVNRWLREAEELAELEPQDGTLWHAYRRMWATARKHHSTKDVAYAGGWAGPETLQQVYQAADADSVDHVVLNPGEVREVYEN